jgi:hypothetical protein
MGMIPRLAAVSSLTRCGEKHRTELTTETQRHGDRKEQENSRVR